MFFSDLNYVKEIKRFLKFAHDHEIPIDPKQRYTGILFVLFGWMLLALDNTIFSAIWEKFPFFEEFFFLFLGGLCPWIIGTLILYFSNKRREIVRFYTPNKGVLVFLRGFFGVVAFYLLSYAHVWVDLIDNAVLFSTDALWVPVILSVFLGKKFHIFIWSGICIGLFGVGMFYFKNFSLYEFGGISGATIAIISAILMSIIIIMSSYMVKNDPPLRIAFYQLLIGLILSGILAIPNWKMPHFDIVIQWMGSGVLYAVALFFFLNSFLYTESFILAVLGYSLIPFTAFFDLLHSELDFNKLVLPGLFLIFVGGLMTILTPYYLERKSWRR